VIFGVLKGEKPGLAGKRSKVKSRKTPEIKKQVGAKRKKVIILFRYHGGRGEKGKVKNVFSERERRGGEGNKGNAKGEAKGRTWRSSTKRRTRG